MVSLIFVDYGHVVKYQGLFFVQLMFSDDLQVINTGVLNMYEWCFLSISIFCEYECVWSFIHCMKSDMTLLMKVIGLVVSTFIGVPPSYERASVSVRWSWVTMCSQRRAEQRREEPCIRKISFPWTSLNPIENFTGIRTAARKVQESETF